MNYYAAVTRIATLTAVLVGCSGNADDERERNIEIDMSSEMLDLNSTSNWDVTNFQFDDGSQVDIPEAAI